MTPLALVGCILVAAIAALWFVGNYYYGYLLRKIENLKIMENAIIDEFDKATRIRILEKAKRQMERKK